MFDVVVVGTGLAGSIAALVARAQGARVAVASRSWGATAMSTGALDIAFTPALAQSQTPRTLAENIQEIIAHRPRHPYGILGVQGTQTALHQGYRVLQESLAGTGLDLPDLHFGDGNLHLASTLGTLLPAATAFAAHRDGPLQRPGKWGIVQLAGDSYFSATRWRRGIDHDTLLLGNRRLEWVEVPVAFPGGRAPAAVARALDDRHNTLALAEQIKPKVRGLDGVIMAPILGLARHAQVRRDLSDAIGVPVVEALAHLPSVPGVRLQQALNAAVKNAGVHELGEVMNPSCTKHRVDAVTTRDNLKISAEAFILATGRFISGGVSWAERCAESLFQLPVVTELGLLEEDSPIAVVRETPVESHPLMTAGIQVNQRLQPIREGRIAFANLFAAGMIIGGFASRYALCADGVALATGWLAAQAACGNTAAKP